MSQHDFNIANQGFPATRSDINNALTALASNSSGISEPSTTYANQFWYDTTNNLLKFRNEADSAWITLAYLDQGTNEWEIRSAVIQAVDSAGITLKTDDGTARVVIQDDGDVAFDTDTLFVDAANNRVGMGTSSPSDKLHVVSNIRIDGSNFAGTNYYGSSVNTTGVYTGLDSGGGFVVNVRDAGYLALSTSNTERMRIKSDGTVLVNATSFFQSTKVGIEAPNVDIFSVRGNNVGAGYRYDSTSSTGLAAYFSHSSNTVAAGSITIGSGSTSYNTSSDYRLKENVTNITDGITRIKQLEPKRFNFIINPDRTVDGFLAHEAQTVVPEAVTGTHNETRAITNAVLSSGGALLAENVLQADWTANKGDDEDDLYPSDSTWTASHTEPVYQGIDQSKLVPLLTAALQEAITKIEDLETRVAALESA